MIIKFKWERSSVWLERMPVTHEVASSSLVVPAIKREPLMGSFFMAELIVVRIAFASSADFGKCDDRTK